MPLSPDGARTTPSRRSALPVGATIAAGFGLTLLMFYPGVMTYDAKFVYDDVAKGFRGDWQSPAMTSLWALIDPLAPGPASMFLLIATLYWLGFGLLAWTLARRSMGLAIVLLVLALSPPAFLLVGIIWRDVLFASTWLLAAALTYALTESNSRTAHSRASGNSELQSQAQRTPPLGPRVRGDERTQNRTWRFAIQVLALALLALGVLLRPNALIAAPILAAYIAWPAQFSCKRAALLFVPAAVGFFALVQVVYYGALGATRQNPLQAIMVFDLGGISHFTKQNQYPVVWSEPESALLLNGCYKPTEWDIYWRHEPCEFVMRKLEKEQKLFGTPAIPQAWARAVMRHPIAYLQHRAAFMWNFLARANLTLWTHDVDDAPTLSLAGRRGFAALVAIDNALKPTPLLRVGPWLLVCIAVCAIGWRRRGTPAGAFALGVCGSAAVYVLTFFAVGVASDFRYGYWAALAGLSGAVVVALRPPAAA